MIGFDFSLLLLYLLNAVPTKNIFCLNFAFAEKIAFAEKRMPIVAKFLLLLLLCYVKNVRNKCQFCKFHLCYLLWGNGGGG